MRIDAEERRSGSIECEVMQEDVDWIDKVNERKEEVNKIGSTRLTNGKKKLTRAP